MNEPGHAHGWTPKGVPISMAQTTHDDFRSHLQWLELHVCDCGNLVAHCVIHDDAIYCVSCGMES